MPGHSLMRVVDFGHYPFQDKPCLTPVATYNSCHSSSRWITLQLAPLYFDFMRPRSFEWDFIWTVAVENASMCILCEL